MSISNIQGQTGAQTAYGLTQTPAPAQTTPAYDAAGHGSNSAASTPDPNPQQASDQIRISSPVTLKNLDTVKAIEQLHNKMNTLIKGVRQTNEVINNASEQITHMSTALENIVKNFPPFPVDSKDRQELLMTYASIRQEILKMSFPPPPAPIYEKVQSTWDSLFAQNAQMLASAVPALENSSPDTQVHEAAQQLQTTSNTLSSLSSATTQALVQA